MRIAKFKERFWAVYDAEDELVCVCVYKRGALEVLRRLQEVSEVNKDNEQAS